MDHIQQHRLQKCHDTNSKSHVFSEHMSLEEIIMNPKYNDKVLALTRKGIVRICFSKLTSKSLL